MAEKPDIAAPAGGFVAALIKRPILAIVVNLLIVLAGFAALNGVEVRELPDVDNPVVTVDTRYPGATPEAVDAEVTSIIEGAVALVDGVTSISSSSSRERSRVVAEFSQSVDINIAATDVKNAVSGVTGRLPEDVEEPQVVKADNDSSPIMRLTVSANAMDPGELADLVEDVVAPRIQSVDGVAQVDVYGDRRRVIRVRIMQDSLAARGLTVADVANLVQGASASAPAGRIRNATQEILIRAETPATTPEDIGRLRLNAQTRVSDVAAVEWSFADETTTARVNGKPGVGIGIVRQAQSNTVAVSKGVRVAMAILNRTLPEGVKIEVSSDDSIFIERSIEEVRLSLLLATLIVIGVIFLFLRSWRATLIPAVTIPISLLGTVAAIYLAGFSINILTLLALVMATGLVVDDAIVVMENIERWKANGAGKRAAAVIGTREIVFAVIATTLTLAAVFVPISFLPGQAGALFSEFGFVLAFAVLTSSFVALSLCPMLSIRFGRDTAPKAAQNRNGVMAKAERAYRSILEFVVNRPIIPVLLSLGFATFGYFAYQGLPNEITPTEDRGRLFMVVQGQEGSTFAYLDDKVRLIEDRLRPLKDAGEAEDIISLSGRGGANSAFVLITLPDWGARDFSQQDMEAKVRPLIASIPGVSAQVRGGNSLGIRGGGQGLQFAVLGDDYVAAAEAAEKLSAVLAENPMFSDVRPNFRFSRPQLSIEVDRETASQLGIPLSAITTTLAAMSDEFRAAELFIGDDVIEVFVSAGGEPVDDPTDIANLFLRTSDGTFVPLSSVARVVEAPIAATLSREDRRRAVPVTATLVEGARLGDAIEALRAVAADVIGGNMSTSLLGEARLLDQSTGSTGVVFAFAAVIVLLVLAAQFESFVSAFIIMLTVPFGLAAAVFAIQLSGGSLNYYSQIGLVLLIGIMAKNGILIVEFANKRRDEGLTVRDAILDASMTRLRPVLMTAISTLLGGLPLILGAGAGAESRAALGWVIFGGLGFATIFTLFLTPVTFLMLARLSKPRASEEQALARELANVARPPA
ncbi:MAG TPA: multidrug transporter AcrB [Parvularcula sp.]|nr:multidrug transporter AcrB [Parvularcula sp.]